MIKRFFFATVFMAGFVVGVLGLNLYVFIKTPSGETTQVVRFDKGTPLNAIVQTLDERGIISNVPLFKAYVLLKRASGRIRAGEYEFVPGLKPQEVLDLLMRGDFARNRITILEGWTIQDIARYLGNLNLVDPDRFVTKCRDLSFILSLGLPIHSLEGYLYPDTYEIYKPRSEEEVIRRLVGRFKEVYAKELEAPVSAKGLTMPQVVTLASIIEKETGASFERPLISSVFWNRLQKGMPLATDPTVIYGIPNFNGNLTREDLARPGPYNTYLNIGLTPTPIASPGLEAMRAAVNPAQTDYLFFVSKNDGTHQFSATYEEHQSAVVKYQINRYRQPETSPNTSNLPR